MVTLKKSLNLLAAVLFTASSVFSYAQTTTQKLENSIQEAEQSIERTLEHVEGEEIENPAELTQAQKVQAHIKHHLADDYSFVFVSDEETGKNYGFPLPVILIDNGLKIFMSSEFDYGKQVVEKDGQFYKLYHGVVTLYQQHSPDFSALPA